jgi:hypothetical protein
MFLVDFLRKISYSIFGSHRELFYITNKNIMKKYGLYYKGSIEPINQIKFHSLEEAILFYAQQKRLMINIFNDLFDVREI